uniref:IF rod domain-containing protein n=1 Tax=Laticauda laticaudata TaxID=8630 RepID=A0A8C5WWU1_LATLA
MESFLSSSQALGEESLQMWDLNKRLEAYLARVKFLEEENELLKAEIQGLKGGLVETPWRAKYEVEVATLRATLDQAYQEKCMVELARDSLYEEVQQVKSRCQRERAAQEEAKMFLSLSKKEMEEEKRAHIWLREKATQLEKEMEDVVVAHQEELLRLDQEMTSFSQRLDGFRVVPICFQPVEVEDYAKRLTNIWKGAVETYKMEVSQLEASLCEAKENLWKATEHKRQNQLQLQQLEKELASLKIRKKTLEESLSQQWAQQQGGAEKLQMAMEALEEEKQSLRGQIAQVLEDRQQLVHLKMSLSLEVATYRALLEAESSRLQLPASDLQLARELRDATTESTLSRLQGPSVDQGRSGSRDVRPSPVTFPMLWGFQSKVESPSWGAKISSSAAREFQKANASLRQSQATKSADGLLPPPKEASAFRLDASQRSQRVTVTHMESLAQSFFCTHPPLAFNSMEPEEALGRSPGGLADGEESGKEEAEREAEGGGEEEGKASGEKEEGEEMPPAEREAPDGPFLSQMVTNEAVETAIQEVSPRETHLESKLLKAGKSPAGISSEEENPLLLRSTEGLEKAQEDHRGGGQPTDPLELRVCEDFVEVNGGQEAWAELQGTEEAWLALEAEAPLALGAELLRAELMEEGGGRVLVPGEKEADEERGSPEWKEREVDEELPALLGGMLGKALGEIPKNSEFAPEGTTNVNGSQEGQELGSSPTDVLKGAPEVDPEENCGGAEDVEVVSPKDLLSQERKEPQSPPRCDLQAEHLEVEGSPAKGGCSPTTPTVLPAGEDQKALFLEAEQENLERREELLPETDAAPPENDEKGSDSEVFCMEENALPRSSGPATDEDGLLASESKAVESREVIEEEEEEEEKGEGAVGPLPTEDMGDEGRMETKGYLDLEAPKGILELGAALPREDQASIQVQETLQGEQRMKGPEEEEQKGGGGRRLPETPLQAEGSPLEERDLVTISGGPESEDVTDALQMEEVRGAVVTESLLKKKKNSPEGSEDKGWGLDSHLAGEQLAEDEGPSREEATSPEEVQEVGSPPEAKASVGESISQREDSGSEETLEHSDFVPDSQSERGWPGEENVQRGETLPGQPALDNGLTMPETPALPSSEGEEVPLWTQEAEPPMLEEEPASLWLGKEDGVEEGPPKGESGHRAQEEGPSSEEPLAAGGSAEALIHMSPFTGDREAEGPREAEQEELEGAPGLEPVEDPWQEGEVARGSAIPKEEVGAELPLEPGDGFGFPADGLDPSYTQQEEEEEEDEDQGPLEFSDQEPTDVAPAKVSPLTGVTDLGEIVLEGNRSLSGLKGAVEPDLLEPCEDKCFHLLDPEDLIQQKIVAVEDPPGTGFPETFPEDVMGLPLESKRDPNILEIVEQALEFNQELRKAAEDELGGLGKGAQHSPEERSLYARPASLGKGPPLVPTEALEGSPPIPREAHPLGGSQANGLREEPSLDEFPSELLNSLGQGEGDPPGDEDFTKQVTVTPQFCTEGNSPMAETPSQSPPPVPAGEEGFRSGHCSPEVLEKVPLDQETLDENILDDLRQKACVKGGKDTKLEPFLFRDEIQHQPLGFQPEGHLDLQPSEDA